MPRPAKKSSETVFAVKLDGMTLDAETSERIAAGVRRVVLSELAAIDVGEGMHVSSIVEAGIGGGGTQGITCIANIAPPR